MRTSFKAPGGRLIAALSVALSLAVAGCGSISRPDAGLVGLAVAQGASPLDPFRFAANDEAAGLGD